MLGYAKLIDTVTEIHKNVVDELGRIVIPIEIREIFDINIKDGLEIFTEDNTIILKKYEPSCVFCGEARDVSDFKGKKICEGCLGEMQG
jgi:AbrB family transcriptional regulator, transcriptional pleiotropic regulator of transition state genes